MAPAKKSGVSSLSSLSVMPIPMILNSSKIPAPEKKSKNEEAPRPKLKWQRVYVDAMPKGMKVKKEEKEEEEVEP